MGIRDTVSKVCRSIGLRRYPRAEGAGLFDPIKNNVGAGWHKLFHPGDFLFEGEAYPYFYHAYNRTWRNERAVEVPIVWKAVTRCSPDRVLEVGNVLSHYFPIRHDVVDKYEKSPGVVNEDVVDVRPSKKYELIVSISTLEHAGWDEEPKDPEKVLRAVRHLKDLLAPGGRMVVTLPLGYNPGMDQQIDDGRLAFARQVCLKRTGPGCRWQEVSWNEVRGSRYNAPYPAANGLVIGFEGPAA